MSKKFNQPLFFDAVRRPQPGSRPVRRSKSSGRHEEVDLYAMRHSLAHILATAIGQLWPTAKFGVGPVVESGFYYDVDLEQTLTPEDLDKIEIKMREVVEADYPFERFELNIDDAIEKVLIEKQDYKAELLKDLKKHGTTSAKDIEQSQLGISIASREQRQAKYDDKVTTVSFFKDGPFEDLCRGPHVGSTGEVGAFKLTKVSGAYWRGKEGNPQMQRVYGVGFAADKELDEYLVRLEEARKRDHRKLGQELDLFAFSDSVGAGLPLWTPRGTFIKTQLQQALFEISRKYRMLPVSIPHIAKRGLYETSGHAAKFSDELFKVESHYKQEFVMKPVNCPHHIQIYASRPRSYRDLPLRYMESTIQYRDEKPGEIGGLTRTRGFMVDDGHLFLRADQIKDEAKALCNIIEEFYQAIGLWGSHWVSLSVQDPSAPEKYIGEPEDWEMAESMLKEVSDELGLEARRMDGEAALYGPKLDFMFKDALNNERQLATVQFDFAMPKRFGITYTDSDGQEKNPVIIHRAILGSYERFIAILIEHFAGAFPVWLAPEQVRIILVNDDPAVVKYAKELDQKIYDAGIQVGLDDSNESVGKKIRAAELMKVPYTLVIGEKELASGLLAPRIRRDLEGKGAEIGVDQFIEAVVSEAKTRARQSSL
ncbi:MAG TPA: threonine--tRNA ligase [Candidatus Saccharimonadales bacterium]|nr:threonine--tRNA ligase [Candidatus Saccharimonadales bacterium]